MKARYYCVIITSKREKKSCTKDNFSDMEITTLIHQEDITIVQIFYHTAKQRKKGSWLL